MTSDTTRTPSTPGSAPGALSARAESGPSVELAVLGGIRVRRDGALVAVTGARARTLLAALALDPGRTRSARGLVDDVWGDELPRSPRGALQTQVSRLRGVLAPGVLESGPAGYRLALDRDAVDVTRAQDVATRLRRHWGPLDHVGRRDGDPGGPGDAHDAHEVLSAARGALALWSGEPGADLSDGQLADTVRARAASLRDELERYEIAALIVLGRRDPAAAAEAARLAETRSAARPGDETALAQAMVALAGAGRPSDALAQFARYRERIADEFGADPSPALAALNVAILGGDLAAGTGSGEFAPGRGDDVPKSGATTDAPAAPKRSTGLRASPNPLLGRAADVAVVEELLGWARVVTVAGPGGTGKTRLAHEVGRAAAATRQVAVVELAPLRSADDVVSAVGSALGISELDIAPGARVLGPAQSLRERLPLELGGRSLLLILDNCEHVVDAVADLVAELVASSDRLSVLTTSRAPLRLDSEVVHPLAPLSPDGDDSPAVALFVHRARAVRPSAHLDPEVVREICRALDGLPLAIELAAARIRAMSAPEIARGLGDRFALLRAGDRAAPSRHRTLHAVIDWSWQLLAPRERAVLRRLARFPSSFDRDAARAVAEWESDDDGPDAAGALVDQSLDDLVDQSLLTVVETPLGVRYSMLETVREFGEEKLAAAGELDEVDRRLAAWSRACAVAVAQQARHDQLGAVRALDADHDTVLVVFRRAVRTRDAATAVTLFAPLALLWTARGVHSEPAAWLPQVTELIRDVDPAEVPAVMDGATRLLLAVHASFAPGVRVLARARVDLRRMLRERDGLSPTLRFAANATLVSTRPRELARLTSRGVRSDDSASRFAAYLLRSHLREDVADTEGALRDAYALLDFTDDDRQVLSRATARQVVASLLAQSGAAAEAARQYELAAEDLLRIGAVDQASQLDLMHAMAVLCAGDVDGARLLRDASMSGDRDQDEAEWRALLGAVDGEMHLADGFVDSGLDRYRRGFELIADASFGSERSDPMGVLFAAAVIGAHVVHGRAASAVDLLDRACRFLRDRTASGSLRDRPVAAALALVSGAVELTTSAELTTSTGDGEALELMALGIANRARQDFPSLVHERYHRLAIEHAGEEAWEAALTAARALPRVRRDARVLAWLTGRS
ncbi:AfsR family transcriptional regulator [Rhodococcus rhodnii]|nr:BTAD domain-containing putative transcriptional regulator [Rhodococcus rhodnii]TXG91953.1 AfsR family transcriptional regulator [Rhodococcus rhodnii]